MKVRKLANGFKVPAKANTVKNTVNSVFVEAYSQAALWNNYRTS